MAITTARPRGVTVLALLTVVFGILGMFSGSVLALGAFSSAVVGVITVAVMLLALASFVFAWGLWNGKAWAWVLTLVFAVANLAFGLLSLPLGSNEGFLRTVLGAAVAYYLTRPGVKRYFGRMQVGSKRRNRHR